MFNEVKTILSSLDNAANAQAVQQAAGDHVQNMSDAQVQQHVQTAAGNATQNGDDSAAQALRSILSSSQQSGGVKQALIQQLTSNPQLLEHFAPEFAKAILSRVV
jgi:predicted solute-binding protein